MKNSIFTTDLEMGKLRVNSFNFSTIISSGIMSKCGVNFSIGD